MGVSKRPMKVKESPKELGKDYMESGRVVRISKGLYGARKNLMEVNESSTKIKEDLLDPGRIE